MNSAPEEALFAAALERPPAERTLFLDGACLGDAALRQRVEALLSAHDATTNLLHSAANPAAHLRFDSPDTPDEAAGQTLGRYKLLEKLGEGGFGTVWAAEQREPVKRRVALKIIKLGMDTKQVVARFEAERQALAMMDHPNIAKVLDAGTTGGGRPYFVMELVRGVRITDYCDQASLGTKERLELFIKVCQAIQHAHQKGIIHRDIKPSNILVTLHDGVPVPKVIDFGIAKATQQELTELTIYTQHHQFIGTPAYMSPEQAEISGLDIDTRSDIYSLGVLLYELLAGSPPFDPKELMSGGIDAMRKTIREKEPQRPSTRLATLGADLLSTTAKRRSADNSKLLHQLKGDLDWIVMKCLEKDRSRRYDTANGLAADIKRHLDNEPVVARPPSAAYRFQKAWRRNRVVFAAGTAAAMALVTGLCLAALGWRQTRAERDKALEARRAAQASEERAIQAGDRAQAGEADARRAAAISRRTAYVADMALAQQAAAEGNLARARHLLDRYRPNAGGEDIRGFEWRYLWAQARSDETARLGGYGGFLGEIALSPDGRFLASVSPRGIEIRSLSNRALILTLTNAGSGPLQFSPDGQHLVTVRDSGLALWNTRTWEQETELAGAQKPFTFAERGQVIVARQSDYLAVYSTTLYKKVGDLPGKVLFHDFQQCMTASPDGDCVFIGYGAMIRGWDLQAGIELEPLSYPAGGWAVAVAVSPQGQLAAAHWNGQVTLWDLATRRLLHTFENHLAWVSAVAFSPDGAYLASASADQNIFLLDTKAGKLVRRFRGHEGEIWALQYSSDGHWLVSGSRNDDSLRLWDATDVARDGDRYNVSRAKALRPVGLMDSSRYMLCQSSNGLLRIEVKTGVIQPISSGPRPWVTPPLKPGDAVRVVSAEGSRIALGSSYGRRLEIWNLLSGRSERILTNSAGPFVEVAFSPDGRHLAATGPGLQTRLYDTLDWSSELLGEPGLGGDKQFAFSSNGSRLAEGHWETEEGLVFDTASRKAVLRFPFRRPMSLAISPDGKLLAAGDSDNAIHLWDVDRGQKLGVLRGHVAGIWNLAFSPDGKTLASCADNRVKLWNLETQQEILTLARFSAGARWVKFVPDGSSLVGYSLDGHFHFWRAPSFEEIAAGEAGEKAEGKRP